MVVALFSGLRWGGHLLFELLLLLQAKGNLVVDMNLEVIRWVLPSPLHDFDIYKWLRYRIRILPIVA